MNSSKTLLGKTARDQKRGKVICQITINKLVKEGIVPLINYRLLTKDFNPLALR
jgi:hypothetical protein